jgi:ParB-like chromosome segregation protein Spo0J
VSAPAEIVIDPAIRALFPPLTPNERANLRDLLKLEGFKEELVVWSRGNVLLDGHARYELARELGIEPRVRAIDLPDREAAVQFVIARQLGRRTLRPIAAAYFIGKLYESIKRQGRRTDLLTSCQADEKWADERVAEQYGVSPRTVARNYELAVALDAVGDEDYLGEEFRALVLAGETRFTRKEIIWLAGADRSEARRWLKKVKEGETAGRRPPVPGGKRKSAPEAPATASDGKAEENDPPPAPPEPPTPTAGPVRTTPTAPVREATAASDPAPDPAGSPATDPAATRPVITRPAVADDTNEDDAGEDASGFGEEPLDEGVLKKLDRLWSGANETTRRTFLGLPGVHAAARRMVLGEDAAAKTGAA